MSTKVPRPSAALVPALDQWRRLIGDEHVVADGERLAAINRSTFDHAQRLDGALYPGSRDDVARCLEVARTHSIALHVVSRGRNWGYGSRLPARASAVLLSLERLGRIELDERLAKVGLEPGVTFGDLERHMRASASALLAPEIGAGPETSVLGNALQRGIAKGPYGSMSAQILALDVLLPDGNLLRTDAAGTFAEPGRTRIAHTAGPALAGLFQQSGLGIVLSGTIALHRAPAMRQLVWCSVRGEALPRALDELRPLLQHADSRLQIEIINSHRAYLQTFGRISLDRSRIDSAWLVAATIWADDEDELAWRRARVVRTFPFAGGDGEALPIEPRERFTGLDWSGLNTAYALLGITPTAGADPDRDGTGMIWVAPDLPFLGEVAARLLPAAGAIIARHGMEPAVSIRPHAGRDLRLVIALVFDRRVAGADRSALACAAELRAFFRDAGYGLYRPSILDTGSATRDPGSAHLLNALVHRLDPGRILAGADHA